MKYYIIVGEASGDLHAAHLMKAILLEDPNAEFRYIGGDKMQAVGGTLVRHYKEQAYMQFIPVLLHLRTILRNMRLCKEDIKQWRPDKLILVDYPGFNLNVAENIHATTEIPIYYYIAPKIWAWKEHRIKRIKRDIDELFSILPFEVPFFEEKHQYPIHYVGNPTVDEIADFQKNNPRDPHAFRTKHHLDTRPIIAILAGSRTHEIKDNLPGMMRALKKYDKEYQFVLAGAPGIDVAFYSTFQKSFPELHIIFNATYPLLQHAHFALVTSGTAALETAIFRVPQIVAYATPLPPFISWLRKRVLKVKYISLPNLTLDEEAVPELVAADFTTENFHKHMDALLPEESKYRKIHLAQLDNMAEKLGVPGAPNRAAKLMVELPNHR